MRLVSIARYLTQEPAEGEGLGRKMYKPLEAIKAQWVEKLGCQDAFCLLPEARLISWLQMLRG